VQECVRNLQRRESLGIPNTHNSVILSAFFTLDCIFENTGSRYSEEVNKGAKMRAPVPCLKSARCVGQGTEVPILLVLPIGGWYIENKSEVLNKSYHERNTRMKRSRGSAVAHDFPLDDLKIGN